MHKLLVLVSILMLLACVSTFATDPFVYDLGLLKLKLPFQSVHTVYLFDVIKHQSLIGGETPVASLYKLEQTIGAVTSLDGQGTPFIGGNFALDNPLSAHIGLGDIKLGAFGGYNFNTHKPITGVKASLRIW